MLKFVFKNYYKVRQGQTIEEIATAFSVSPYLLAKENQLNGQPFCGQILKIPSQTGHRYTVQAGDTKQLLSGSEEKYREKNGTDVFYIGMEVIL